MKSLTISTRIWLLAAVYTLLVAAVGGFGEWNTMKLTEELDAVGHTHLIASRDMTLIDMFHDGLAAKVYKALEYSTQKSNERLTETKKEADEMAEAMRKTIGEVMSLHLSPSALANMKETLPSIETYIHTTTTIVAKIVGSGRSAALADMGGFESAFKDLEGRLDKLGEQIENDAKDKVDSATQQAVSATKWNFGIIVVGLLFGLLCARWFVQDLFRTLSQVADSFNNGSLKLVEFASQIGIASSSLAESTTEQSSAIEETVSSMEEMGSMIAQTNQNAELTTREADTSVHDAQSGRQVVATMVHAMKEISGANDRLKAIVTVIEDIKSKTKIINDIAFETRLLAFNASIEAARAGAHGRGFAVVAEEVGKLANVSGKAADEVRALLDESVAQVSNIVTETSRKVEDGHSTSQLCEQAFGKMESSVNKITQGIQRISAATKEQDVGVRQTNKAMVEMEKVTQSNSRNAEKLSSQSGDLRRAANDLQLRAREMQILVIGKSHDGPGAGQSPLFAKDARAGAESKASVDLDAKAAVKGLTETAVEGNDVAQIDRDDSRWHAA